MNFSFQLKIPQKDTEKEYLKFTETKLNSVIMCDEN